MQEGAPAAPHKLHFKNQTASPKGEVGCSQQSLSLSPLPWGVFIVFSSQLRTINTPVCYLDQNCFPLHLSGPCSCLNSAVSSLLQVTYHIFLPSFPSWLCSSGQFWVCFSALQLCCLSDEHCWKLLQSKVWIHMFQLSSWASCKKARSPAVTVHPQLQHCRVKNIHHTVFCCSRC